MVRDRKARYPKVSPWSTFAVESSSEEKIERALVYSANPSFQRVKLGIIRTKKILMISSRSRRDMLPITSNGSEGAETTASTSEVNPPPIPYVLYQWVKEADAIMNCAEWSMRNFLFTRALDKLEGNIEKACDFFSPYMPTGWKYERRHARSLLEGYDSNYQIKWKRNSVAGSL